MCHAVRFGDRIRKRIGVDDTVLSTGSMADVDRAATRPSYTCLDVSSVESALGQAQPSLADDLDEERPFVFRQVVEP